MAATGILGMTLFTSATALTNIEAAADAIADFQALTVATAIGLVENFPPIGRVFQDVPFTVLGGRVYHLKGSYDMAPGPLVVGADLSDAGQLALKGYAEAIDQATYPFKMVLVGADASYDTIYFGAKIMSCVLQMGDANTVLRANIQLGFNTPMFQGAT